MTKYYEQLWKGVPNANDDAQVRTMAEIVAEKEGRVFIPRLDGEDAVSAARVLDKVSRGLNLPFGHLRRCRQGISEHDLRPAEKQAFFLTLRRLAERHGSLPDRMKITERVEVSDAVLASNGFTEIRSGMYMGCRVAVKAIRVTAQDNFPKIRKVSTNVGHQGWGLTIPLSDFARKLFSGARSLTRTPRNSLGSGATWREDNSQPCQSGWSAAISWSSLRPIRLTDWSWYVTPLSLPLPPPKCDNSCTEQPRV